MDGLSKLARSAVVATGCNVYGQLWDEGAGDWRRSGAVMGGLGWTYAQRGALTREAANAAVILREGTAPIKPGDWLCEPWHAHGLIQRPGLQVHRCTAAPANGVVQVDTWRALEGVWPQRCGGAERWRIGARAEKLA